MGAELKQVTSKCWLNPNTYKQVQYCFHTTQSLKVQKYSQVPCCYLQLLKHNYNWRNLLLKIQPSDRAGFLRHFADASTRSKHHSFSGERHLSLHNAQVKIQLYHHSKMHVTHSYQYTLILLHA